MAMLLSHLFFFQLPCSGSHAGDITNIVYTYRSQPSPPLLKLIVCHFTSHIHTQTHPHKCMYIHMHTSKSIYMHPHTRMIHPNKNTHIFTHPHPHTHLIHTHMYMHTHITLVDTTHAQHMMYKTANIPLSIIITGEYG